MLISMYVEKYSFYYNDFRKLSLKKTRVKFAYNIEDLKRLIS